MIKSFTITVSPEEENSYNILKLQLIKELKKAHIEIPAGKILIVNNPSEKYETSSNLIFIFEKKSIDARHGQIKLHLRYKAYINESPEAISTSIPEWKKADKNKKILIIGSGPAGLFAALKLLEFGIKPIIIERGAETSQRRKDIALISTKDLVNANSNYCFGEGGAGTFSDGKLYTRSNKRGDISGILRIFSHFGANEKILTDAHPHIGTDKLPQVINNMREKIIELGGQFYFNTKLTEFVIKDKTVKGISAENTVTGEKITLEGDAVILATGHSAMDIYELIAKNAPAALEAKTFAAGVRVEHPRELIDKIQYHGKTENMPAAEYRVTAQVENRGVYSFCMCPGGFVVPSASGSNEIVVNGMSAAARNSKWSNAAIVVEIRPEDIPAEFVKKAKDAGCPQMAGLFFRTDIEQKAMENGNGQAAPAQKMVDFIKGRKSIELPKSSYTPGLVSSDLNEWMPSHIAARLKKGFEEINKNMKGFISPDALMIAPETRTSTPVRILRDKETYECTEIKNLYPVGEGSGYSGGIVSSAMDGENAAVALNKQLYK